MDSNMLSLIAGAVLGTVFSVLTTIIIEGKRRPRIDIELIAPTDIVFPPEAKRPATNLRSVRLLVKNKQLSLLFKWLSRDTALQCHAHISFRNLQNNNSIVIQNMPARWSNSLEPLSSYVIFENRPLPILNLALESRKDIPAGQGEPLDIIAHFDDDQSSYVWNNETYISEWRDPKRELPFGRYLVDVTVSYAGGQRTQSFRLHNDVPRSEINLSHTLTDDRTPDS